MLKAAPAKASGATFALDDVGFIDFESRSETPIEAGTDVYARDAQAIMLAWAIGGGPVNVLAVGSFARPLRWFDMPLEFQKFFARVEAGQAVFCAHHATFDRAIWNHATSGFPRLEPEMIIDSRVQAVASGLPADLEKAARYATTVEKLASGKDLIALFCAPGCTAQPSSHPDEWRLFKEYAAADITAMRALFLGTRQLPINEWDEYWAAEAINERGIGVDLTFVAAAAAMAAEDKQRSAAELSALTSGKVKTVDGVKTMVEYLRSVLPTEALAMLIEVAEEKDEEGNVTRPHKWQLTRSRVIRLLAWLHDQEHLSEPLRAAERLLQIRRYGGSKTPAKFARILGGHVGGVIRNQYVFNGAAQTGRFSARGIQVHNLARDTLPYEIDAIDALVGGVDADAFARLGDDTPISRKLSLLIRPALVPETGNVFVWGDWANIEARVLPWLADSPEADRRLDIFRQVDADPRIPDIYTRTAAVLSGIPVEAVDKKIRQRGKVTELACGFGGGVAALLHMAASYGMHLDEAEAQATVDLWRHNNAWAKRFWGYHRDDASYGLWGALNQALENPGQTFAVGRVSYHYWRGYLGGSLFCMLPSGRVLTYRRIKWEMVDVLDEDDKVVDVRRELMFSRDHGRVKMWPGLACENIVQATAADILRGTLVRLADFEAAADMPVRLHTHDEVLVECPEGYAAAAAANLRAVMEIGWGWSRGLPIKADTTAARWYTKAPESEGL